MFDFMSIAIPQLVVAVLFFIGAMVLLKRPERYVFLLSPPRWIAKWVWGLAIFFAGLYLFDELSLLFLQMESEPVWFQRIDTVLDWPPVFWLSFTGSLILLVEFALAQTSGVEVYDRKPKERLRFIIMMLALYGFVFNIATFFWSGFFTNEFSMLALVAGALLSLTIISCYFIPFFYAKGDTGEMLEVKDRVMYGSLITRIGFISGFLVLTESIISRAVYTVVILGFIAKKNKHHDFFNTSRLSQVAEKNWIQAFSFYFMITMIIPMILFWSCLVRPFPPDATYLESPFSVSILYQVALTYQVMIHIISPKRRLWYVGSILIGLCCFHILPLMIPSVFAMDTGSDFFDSVMNYAMRPLVAFIHISCALVLSTNYTLKRLEVVYGISDCRYARAVLLNTVLVASIYLLMAPITTLLYPLIAPEVSSSQLSLLAAIISVIVIAVFTWYFMAFEKSYIKGYLDELMNAGEEGYVRKVMKETPVFGITQPFAAFMNKKPKKWRFAILYPIALSAIPLAKLVSYIR